MIAVAVLAGSVTAAICLEVPRCPAAEPSDGVLVSTDQGIHRVDMMGIVAELRPET